MLPSESCQVDTLWTAIQILEFVKLMDMFPNAIIAYRIFFNYPWYCGIVERNFLKLKLLKSYMRTTLTQDRLNGLALICIEKEMLENIQYDDIIDEFAFRSAS
ncbi:hypothetical protein ACOSQ3_006539 [Xanthoceras sorbifolium]